MEFAAPVPIRSTGPVQRYRFECRCDVDAPNKKKEMDLTLTLGTIIFVNDDNHDRINEEGPTLIAG